MNWEKKGIEKIGPITFLLGSIILLLVFMLMIFFQSQLMEVYKSAAYDNMCKASVETYSKLKLSGEDFFEVGELDCPTHNIVIDDDGEVLGIIADSLDTCWGNFGSGKLELFKNVDEMYCVICSQIEFDGLKGTKPGLLKYLTTQKPANSDKTYFERLNGVEFSEHTLSLFENYVGDVDKDSISLDNPLSVVFVYDKEALWDKKLSAGVGAGTGGAAGGAALGSLAAYAFVWKGVSILGFTINPLLGVATVGAAGITSGALAGSTLGYLLGSDSSAEWEAKVLLVPYDKQNIKNLGCTYLPIKGEPRETVKK